MNYTKKNLNIITLLITISFFILLYFLGFQIISLFNSEISKIYSKTIPIEKYNNQQKIIDKNVNPFETEYIFRGNNSQKDLKQISQTQNISLFEQSIINAPKTKKIVRHREK